MDECVYPAEAVYHQQMAESGDPHSHPQVLEDLKLEARSRGMWNLFHPDPDVGHGLSNLEYAPLAEVMGRSHLAPEACNCSAPDSGNMEVLSHFGTQEHKDTWLRPLLAGEIRSTFCMTEPAVASSDATNMQLRMERVGDEYVLNGRKWWSSNIFHPNCRVLLVMGQTDPDGPRHRQHSMMVVPRDAPGVTVLRNLPVFGFTDREGHGEVLFEDVRVPASALLAAEGDGFKIGQSRLGPGRIHHCMRSVGMAERSLDHMISRAQERTTFGKRLIERDTVREWIAEARIEIEMVRLLVLKTAWLMDSVGNQGARKEIAAIKVAAPAMALKVIDRAIQLHGGGGVTNDFPMAQMWTQQRALRIADGPDQVHLRTLARLEVDGRMRSTATEVPS